MGGVLLNIKDYKTRNDMKQLFKVHNLDLPATLRRTIENALTETEEEYKRDDMPTNIALQFQILPEKRRTMLPEDELLIRTMEWMLLVDHMRDDLVGAGNIVYKRFLCKQT